MDISKIDSPVGIQNHKGNIGQKVRELRLARRLTQVELAKHLRLSQARLSEIERGDGSFTAEHFLQILRLFNVAVTDFDDRNVRDQHAQLQNALVRLGAADLYESENVLPSAQVQSLNSAIRETLVEGNPRLLAALGPVIVRNIDRLNLRKLYLELSGIGLERRLAWLVENIYNAISELPPKTSPKWSKSYRRAIVVLEPFLEFVKAKHPSSDASDLDTDILDADIRSKQSLAKVRDASSDVSKSWGIVTSIQLSDFQTALESARDAD